MKTALAVPRLWLIFALILLVKLVRGQETIQAVVEEPECEGNSAEECLASADPKQEGNFLLDTFSKLFDEAFKKLPPQQEGDEDAEERKEDFLEKLLGLSSSSSSSTTNQKNVQLVLEKARKMTAAKDKSRTFQEEMDVFFTSFDKVFDALHRTIAPTLEAARFTPLSFWYYLEHEDEVKNPSWKRRQHRYHRRVETKTVVDLHDALYLSQLAYVNSVEQLEEGLVHFRNNTWELVYNKLEGLPNEPAHFLAIPTQLQHDIDEMPQFLFPWEKPPVKVLDVLFVVRGTKELGDVLSDGLLDAVDYRGGQAHAGILQSGINLAAHHTETLQHLLEMSGQDEVRLILVGHSLGAGAAAIAAMEFNDVPKIQATAIGFGCPALLSPDLSKSTQEYIVTVVADADVIPRTSGANLVNMLMDVLAYDWTSKGLQDLEALLVYLNDALPFQIPREKLLNLANRTFDQLDRPHFEQVPKERLEPVLFPPGNCVHLFRDGFGYTGTYTPCEFFDSVEMTRTLINDHMVDTGYHRAFLALMRDKLSDVHFDFQHNLMALPV